MATVNKQTCPTCGQSVNERQVSLFKGLVAALWSVFQYCAAHEVSTFRRKDVKNLFTSENQTTRFGDWIWFDPNLIRRDGLKKGHYELNMARAADFFAGLVAIPTVVWKNPLTGEIKRECPLFVYQIKGLSEFLIDNDEFVSVYRNRKSGLFY